MRGARLLAMVALGAISISGCTSNPSAKFDSEPGYNTDSRYVEIAASSRGAPVSFGEKSDHGNTITSKSLLGHVYVVNFWYAGCAPCMAEASTLQTVFKSYRGSVPFVGVNTYDQAGTARAFERNMGVTYPSIIDTNNVRVQLAFSTSVPPNSTPATLIVDSQGRVAARIIGIIESPSILKSMVDRELAR